MSSPYQFVDVEPCVARGRFLGWDRHDPAHWVCERKYDGERRVCQVIDGIGYFTGRRFSRAGERLEKGANLFHLLHWPHEFDGMILDGEVYLPGRTSTDMTAIMSCKDPAEAERKIRESIIFPHYAIFDIIAYPGRQYVTRLPLYERRQILEGLWPKLHDWRVGLVHLAARLNFESDYNGEQEGVVLKDLRSRYVYGPCGSWVKVKHTKTATVKVLGFQPGVGKYRNTLGAIIYGGVVEGQHIRGACSGMTDLTRNKIWLNQATHLGLPFDVEYARISDGTLVQARFDKWRIDRI